MGVDSAAAAGALAAAVPGARVLIEVDSGQHRSGVPVSQVTALAAECRALGLDVIGAFTHPGHAYGKPDPAVSPRPPQTSGPRWPPRAARWRG